MWSLYQLTCFQVEHGNRQPKKKSRNMTKQKTPQWYGQLLSWSSPSPSQTACSSGQRPTSQPPQPDWPPQPHMVPTDRGLALESEIYGGYKRWVHSFNIEIKQQHNFYLARMPHLNFCLLSSSLICFWSQHSYFKVAFTLWCWRFLL